VEQVDARRIGQFAALPRDAIGAGRVSVVIAHSTKG